MAPSTAGQHARYPANSGEDWAAEGPNRMVKVVGMNILPPRWTVPSTSEKKKSFDGRLQGYVTREKYLVGLTPYQMQRALGLQLGDLRGGCLIYRFARLPKVGECQFRGTADLPDGDFFDPASLDYERMKRKLRAAENGEGALPPPRRNMYRSGSPHVEQWTLLDSIEIDGDPYRLFTGVAYPQRY